jgi:hydroxymethylpyrimidine pyrophosphatase-like HAD family hydrolase
MTIDGRSPTPVVCFDFDGTLVDAEGHIHPSDVAILKGRAPITFVPATGRPLHAVRHTLGRHGVFVNRPISFPLILANGAVIYDANENVLEEHPFDSDVDDALMGAMLASPQVTFLLFNTDEVRMLWPSDPGCRMAKRFALDTAPFSPHSQHAPLTKAVAIAGTPQPLWAFVDRTRQLPMERSFSLPTVLELTRLGVDKATGLKALLRGACAGMIVVAAGDGENDLPLFEVADITFAPADSPREIRRQADHVVDVRRGGLLAPILRAIGMEPGGEATQIG